MTASDSQKTWTTSAIRRCKGREKVVTLTAYDFATARMLDELGFHICLVGDSLGMTVLGYESTIPVTMEDMLHHTAAVARGAKHSLVVADMPFLSYQASMEQAIDNAGRLMKDAQAGAVKIEGGAIRRETVETLIANGIPVMGHIGLTPQSVKEFGGYKVQGRDAKRAETLRSDAKILEEAGCFAIVLEGMPRGLAGEITRSIGIPTIGIGAGPDCDGQVLVVQDVLGMFTDFTPKFVKKYADLSSVMHEAFAAYHKDVQEGTFPDDDHCYD